MATLSSVTQLTRKVLEITGISIFAVILLIIIFRIALVVKEIFAPTPPPAPTVAFGKLPAQDFPQSLNGLTYTYSINTLTGSLPGLPDRIHVYKITQPLPNLLGLDSAKTIAKTLDFINDPVALSDLSYRWTKADPLPTTLTMDIQSFDFVLSSDFITNKTVTDAARLPDQTTALDVANGFFNKTMPLPNSIDTNKTKTTLLAIKNGQVIGASSLSDAQLIRIDYFPKAIDKLPILTANPDQSLIYALVASSDTDYPQIVAATYYHKNISSENATYPTKNVSKAFDELKQGNAYIAANPTGATNIAITNVYFAYYVDTSPQQYLWPIIVFQGDKGFYAYVSAVTNEWISPK